ncbi:MAG: hypothetical protein R2939_02720 [Kofleriaceae bacterium]
MSVAMPYMPHQPPPARGPRCPVRSLPCPPCSPAWPASPLLAAGCTDDGAEAHDPATADRVVVDRFGAGATLMVRTAANGLPAAGAPVDFDQAPFITHGLGPGGEEVAYYNFDVQPRDPASIYVLFEAGASEPVAGQLNIVDVVPGDAGYSDFWQVVRVDVPAGYVANTVASLAELEAAGYAMTVTTNLVNCPIVPPGSTATQRVGGGGTALHQGWYREQVVTYFTFEEAALTVTSDEVPVSPIFVTFNVNPDQPDGGPGSGFVVEPGTAQTHNVLGSLPGDLGYSPLWAVSVYDNADFDAVDDLDAIGGVTVLADGVANVNCPVVSL